MDIFAHRGASGSFPENTVSSFKEAARLPIFGVEFDVHMSSDGELVVIHDETIDRTSNGMGFIKDMTLEDLKQFDYGGWFSPEFRGETIPTLSEVLDIFQPTELILNIELKSDVFPYNGMVEKVLAMISKKQMEECVILSSFDHSAIQLVKKLAPQIETAALFMEVLVHPLDYIRSLPTNALHVFFPTAVRPSLKEIYEAEVPVRAFTVNEPEQAKTLKQAGVQAIFTDFPEKMASLLNNQ
ncbi:glycerophosphodiester phosphodiesterase [Sporosarcina thermotolerans]|uniref:Glycerophosphodiester phosphodiesterase n=1 Tax=Sporosarcina thermotolerans TaxID=633404 RepID=A0AAW9ABT2_9BACL|nr:glycerophosphodiester phosphodiesterase [Sporosarcina thermotolerans]